jgi:hypothetical protein
MTIHDLIDNESFCKERPLILKEIIDLKKIHRLFLGEHATMLFESKRLVWWQIQEMLRIEQGGQEQALQELETYNPLVPDAHTLTATLMWEIANPEERKQYLKNILGIEHYIHLVFNNHFLPAHLIEFSHSYVPCPEKASSVYFIKFIFSEQARKDFAHHVPLVRINHPYYQVETEISSLLWESLKACLEI